MGELKEGIKKFEKMLRKTPDNPKYTYDFLYFFKNFSKIKSQNIVPPIVELGAILKQEKSVIFHELRKFSSYNQTIDFITNVEMNYEEAREKLDNIKKQLEL